MTTNTSEMFKLVGGETANAIGGYTSKNTQPEYRSPSKGSEFSTLTTANIESVNSMKFDTAVAFFERKGVPRSVARTYGISLIETAKITGKDIFDLINNEEDFTFLDDNSLVYININRPKTSQIGYKQDRTHFHNENIIRTIIV